MFRQFLPNIRDIMIAREICRMGLCTKEMTSNQWTQVNNSVDNIIDGKVIEGDN